MIAAVGTNYRGVAFRSRLEAKFAVLFDRLGLWWWYEPHEFSIGGFSYTPDFAVSYIGHCLDAERNFDHSKCLVRDGVVSLLEVKPEFDVVKAKRLVRWLDGIRPDSGDSQIINAWNLASQGYDIWYATGEWIKSETVERPKFIRTISYTRGGFPPIRDAIEDSGVSLKNAVRAAKYFRFGCDVPELIL